MTVSVLQAAGTFIIQRIHTVQQKSVKPVVKWIRTVRMLLSEYFSVRSVARIPEPDTVMDHAESVGCFSDQGRNKGYMVPVYHLNAQCISRILPRNGHLLDLGSGAGRFLVYLASLRPDITITGIELSGNMIQEAETLIRETGCADRISMCRADMTRVSGSTFRRPDVVSAIYSLHHLPALSGLRQCINQVSALRKKFGCGIWIFDHTRPRTARTAEEFPEIFTPNAPAVFKKDSANSLKAAFSFVEIRREFERASVEDMHHRCSRILRLFQAHWAAPVHFSAPEQRFDPPPARAGREFLHLNRIFGNIIEKVF